MPPDPISALNLLQAAEAAETDSALVGWVQRQGLSDQEAAQLLQALRETRDRRRGKEATTV